MKLGDFYYKIRSLYYEYGGGKEIYFKVDEVYYPIQSIRFGRLGSSDKEVIILSSIKDV